jgi:hypothetical protein
MKAPAHNMKSLRFSTPITGFQPLFNLTSQDAECRMPRECAPVELRHKSPVPPKSYVHMIGNSA